MFGIPQHVMTERKNEEVRKKRWCPGSGSIWRELLWCCPSIMLYINSGFIKLGVFMTLIVCGNSDIPGIIFHCVMYLGPSNYIEHPFMKWIVVGILEGVSSSISVSPQVFSMMFVAVIWPYPFSSWTLRTSVVILSETSGLNFYHGSMEVLNLSVLIRNDQTTTTNIYCTNIWSYTRPRKSYVVTSTSILRKYHIFQRSPAYKLYVPHYRNCCVHSECTFLRNFWMVTEERRLQSGDGRSTERRCNTYSISVTCNTFWNNLGLWNCIEPP